MGVGDGDDCVVVTVAVLQCTADGIQTEGFQMVARALVVDGAEGVFELAPAHVQGEAEVRDLHRVGEVIAHPGLGAAGEPGAIAHRVGGRCEARGEFAGGGEGIGDGFGDVVHGRRCRGSFEKRAGFLEAELELSDRGFRELADGEAVRAIVPQSGESEAAAPHFRRDGGGQPSVVGGGAAVDFVIGGEQGDGPRCGRLAIPDCFAGTEREAKRAPAAAQHAADAGADVRHAEVEGPSGTLELLHVRGAFLPSLEVHAELDARDRVAELIGLGDDAPRVAEGERGRGERGHGAIVRKTDSRKRTVLAGCDIAFLPPMSPRARTLPAILLGIFCAVLPIKTQAAAPHILYIVADDLGWKDVGFHGSEQIKTPNLDTLAAEGARLERFYVQPMCTPTRAALMTGRYPFRYGLQTIVIPSKGTYGLATDEYTLPQTLKDGGYQTAAIGKWHLGHADRKYWPRQRGFDYHYGAVLGEIDYFTHSAHDVMDWQRDNQPVKEEGYVTQLLGKDAVKLIGGHDATKPLFLYLAFTAAHAPYQAPQDYLDRYKNIADETRRAYAGQITCMDDEIGKVLEALDKKGMRKDTLIVFHGDNGGTRDARITGESKVKTVPCDNGALKGGKGQLYEGGTRVPAFANWPGHIKAGEVKEVMHVVDMLPTLAKLGGASTEKSKPLDGRDVWPTIAEGKPSGREEVVYNIEPFRGAVRQGDWKLVWRCMLPTSIELFNVAEDPNETTNLADKQPEKVKALQARMEQLAKESAKPLFMETAMQAVFSGVMGPAPIPTEENSATAEP